MLILSLGTSVLINSTRDAKQGKILKNVEWIPLLYAPAARDDNIPNMDPIAALHRSTLSKDQDMEYGPDFRQI